MNAHFEEVNVFSLAADAAGDLTVAGGKAVGLHALIRLGLPVPPGFCISARAFREALDAAGCLPLVVEGDRLDPSDGAAVRAHAARVREALHAMPLPPAVEQAVLTQWREGLGGAAVAVRSSATAEDLEDASFAGQQDTVLGVTDEQALRSAVRTCWASLFTDRALIYRLHRGVSSAGASMGVIVQRMVQADVAGVLFTADPITGNRAVLTLEAVSGLGEALVSGHAAPDAYRISKRDGAILELRAGGGRTLPLLSPETLGELVALGRRVEDGRGSPQDIEWAVEDGRCWLVQTRAITTLNPLPAPADPQGRWRVFASFGHFQVNTAPLSPLGLSLIRTLPPFERDPLTGESTLAKEAGGRAYVDVTPVLASAAGPRFTAAMRSMSSQLADRLEVARHRPELRGSAGDRPFPVLTVLRRGLSIARRALKVLVRPSSKVASEYAASLRSLVATQEQTIDRETGAARLLAVRRVMGGVFEALLLGIAAPVVIVSFAGERLLRSWTQRFAPGLAEDVLLRGLEGNVVTEMNLAIGDLADRVRTVPALREALSSADPKVELGRLRGDPETGPFFHAWDEFLERFGQRAAGEIDVAVPRWRDDPGGPLKTIAALLGQPAGAHRAQQREAREAADRARDVLVTAARSGPLGALRARVIAAMVPRLRAVIGLREHHKEALTQVLMRVRSEFLAAAQPLVAAGALGHPDEVWQLTLPELIEATLAVQRGQQVIGLRERVEERRRDRARYAPWSPPPVLTSDGEAIAPASTTSAPVGTWVGTAVSSGVVEGTVRVVLDPGRETIAPGEILVAPFTDPGWTPLFLNARALVMEVGGSMSHGSVVARELGIPAVVGIDGATRRLQTGMKVRVDGDRGWVTVIGAEAGERPETFERPNPHG